MFNSIDRDTKLSRKAAQIIDRQEGIHQNQPDCAALFGSGWLVRRRHMRNFLTVRRELRSGGSVLTDFFGATTSIGASGRLKRL
jgi:hypothetical protein